MVFGLGSDQSEPVLLPFFQRKGSVKDKLFNGWRIVLIAFDDDPVYTHFFFEGDHDL